MCGMDERMSVPVLVKVVVLVVFFFLLMNFILAIIIEGYMKVPTQMRARMHAYAYIYQNDVM